MKKKIITLLVSSAMALSNITAISHAADSVSTEFKTLAGLGMLPEEWVNGFNPDATVTRGKFFTILSEILYPGKAVTQEEAVAVLNTSGIVDSPEDPLISTSVTYAQAVKMVTVAAGYKVMADAQGGWPGGYISAASYSDITDGVNGSDSEAITAGNVVKLLYNLLHTEVLEENVFSAEGGYKISDETVLEKYRGIYYAEGLMTANGITALDEPEYYMPGEIVIGGISYETDTSEFNGLIGYQTDVYYTEDAADERKAVLVTDKTNKNSTLTITSKQIKSVTERVDVIEYYKDVNGSSLTKANLSPSMSVIYNGKAVAGYTKEDFTFKCGQVKLIDNDNDKKYDVAEITCYENMLAEGVDLNENIIHNGFEYPGAIDKLEADKEYGDYILEVYQDDVEVGIEGIAVGNILSIAKSKSAGHNVIRIYLNDKRTTATLSGYNTSEKEVTINGEVYSVAESYYKLNAAKAEWGSELKVGNNYEFAFDVFGNVAGVKQKATDGEFYAYLFNAYSDEDTEKMYVKYLSEDGAWYTRELADKVKFNGVRDDASVCFKALGSSKNTNRQLIRVKENNDGQVTELRTAVETNVPDEAGFTKGQFKNNKYFIGNRSMQGEVYAASGAVWFNIPDDSSSADVKDNEDYYYIASPEEEFYDYVGYDMDEFFCAKAFILYTEATGTRGDYFLVEDVETVLSSEGGAATRIRGQYGDFDEVAFIAADDKVLESVQKGDFIRLYFNGNGYISGYETIYQVSQGNNYSLQCHQGNWGAASQWDTGRLEDISIEKGFMKVSVVGGKEYSLRLGGSVRLYDVKEKEFKDSGYAGLQPGDFIVFHMSYYNVGRVVAYRF